MPISSFMNLPRRWLAALHPDSKDRLHTPLWFTIALLASGYASLRLGQDTVWDLKNYHLYNPWALLNGRLDLDIAAAQLQTYYNPALDLVFYGLLHLFRSARATAFVMGGWTGIAALFFARIAWLCLAEIEARKRLFYWLAALAIGLTGTVGYPLIGTTTNDWPVCAMVMAGLYVALKGVPENSARVGAKHLLGAGLLLGLAVGLKLTVAMYAVGTGVALLFFRRPGKAIVLPALAFGGGVVAGLAIAGGPWMWVMYERFGNPLFPYFNDIFRSPYWDAARIGQGMYHPQSLSDWLWVPFMLAEPNGLLDQPPTRDLRFGLTYFFGVLFALYWLQERWFRRAAKVGQAARMAVGPRWRFLFLFVLASYGVWLDLHRIYRYLMPMELIAALMLVFFIYRLLDGTRVRGILIMGIVVLVMYSSLPPNWGRIPFGRRYFDVQLPPIPENTLVVFSQDEPLAYLAPFFPPGTRFVAAVSNITGPAHKDLLQTQIESAIAHHTGPMRVLRVGDRAHAGEFEAMRHYGIALDLEQCEPVRTNISIDRVEVCPARKN